MNKVDWKYELLDFFEPAFLLIMLLVQLLPLFIFASFVALVFKWILT